MTDDRPPEVLGALPRTRPHRRSDKRGTRPAKASPASKQTKVSEPSPRKAAERKSAQPTPIRRTAPRKPRPQRLKQPAQPAGTPVARRERAVPSPPSGTELVGTVVHAAAELAEIGLTAGARALRNALTRLPRP